jgi:hypothetical protein
MTGRGMKLSILIRTSANARLQPKVALGFGAGLSRRSDAQATEAEYRLRNACGFLTGAGVNSGNLWVL